MLAFSCSFCHHVNPPGSKFCNECGSPLRLTPCPACDAVNDLGSAACYRCGASLSTQPSMASKVAGDRAPSFDERLDGLRRDLGAPREGLVEARPAASASAAIAASRTGVDAAGRRAEVRRQESPPASNPAFSLEPAPWGANGAAAPSAASPSHTSAHDDLAKRPMPVALEGTMVRPAAATQFAPHKAPSRLLYVVASGLIFVGIAGYAYLLYGPSPRLEQWLGSLRQALGSESTATAVASGSNPQGDAAISPRSDSPAAGDSPGADEASAPRSALEAPSLSAMPAAADTANRVESSAVPAQTTAPAGGASAGQVPPVAEPVTTETASAPPVAAASTKHAARGKPKRAATRKPTPGHSEMAPQPPMQAAPEDTRATTALPGDGCTRAVAALGLCNRDREAN